MGWITDHNCLHFAEITMAPLCLLWQLTRATTAITGAEDGTVRVWNPMLAIYWPHTCHRRPVSRCIGGGTQVILSSNKTLDWYVCRYDVSAGNGSAIAANVARTSAICCCRMVETFSDLRRQSYVRCIDQSLMHAWRRNHSPVGAMPTASCVHIEWLHFAGRAGQDCVVYYLHRYFVLCAINHFWC